jgi:hypothetical protein
VKYKCSSVEKRNEAQNLEFTRVEKDKNATKLYRFKRIDFDGKSKIRQFTKQNNAR